MTLLPAVQEPADALSLTDTVTCASSTHEWLHPGQVAPAVVIGTFDPTDINQNPIQPGIAYCQRCAVLLADAGLFTPHWFIDPAFDPLPDAHDLAEAIEYLRETPDF